MPTEYKVPVLTASVVPEKGDLIYFDGTNWIKINSKNIGLVNLVSNGDFENWSAGTSVAPDGWILSGSGAAIAREASIIKLGTYSAKLTRNSNDCIIYQTFYTERGINYWKSRKVTASCWVYATVADRARIGITDGISDTIYSSYHTGNSTWQFLTVTTTLSSGATTSHVDLRIDTGDTSAYFDGAMCVEGESAFSFSPKPLSGDVAGEIYSLTNKATPVDADVTLIEDSAATPTNQKKKLSWTNIKATLKTYFDTLYTVFVKNDGTVNPTNLVSNGDFENWSAGTSSAPDGWVFAQAGGGTIAREASTIKMGTYSAKIVSVAGNWASLQNTFTLPQGLAYWKGRKVTFSCWVWCATASVAYIEVYTAGGDRVNSPFHTGDSTWQLLKITYTIPSNATVVSVLFSVAGAGGYTVYYDGAMCVEGESIFAFSDKPLPRGGTIAVEIDETKFSHKIPVYIDGTLYYIMLTQT